MNRKKPSLGTMTITGGTFVGNAVGQGNKVSHNTITVGEAQAPISLDDLRQAIAAACDELVSAAGSPQAQAEVRYEIRKIEQELTGEQPEASVVRSRWEQVSQLLGPLVTVSDIVTRISDLITKVFGGS